MPVKIHVSQEEDSFKVTSDDKKSILFQVEKKRASTIPDFKIRDGDDVYVGAIRGDELVRFHYNIYARDDHKIGQVVLKKKGTVEHVLSISYSGVEFEVRDLTRGKNIEVKDSSGGSHITIDKKIMRIKDSYTVKVYSDVDLFLAVCVTVIIDDIYFNN